jgi:hypothetical protein
MNPIQQPGRGFDPVTMESEDIMSWLLFDFDVAAQDHLSGNYIHYDTFPIKSELQGSAALPADPEALIYPFSETSQTSSQFPQNSTDFKLPNHQFMNPS